jgi:hypothetical protein
MSKPNLLMVFGPTGAGKSSLPYKVEHYLKLSPRKYVYILIDDLVAQNPNYKRKIHKIIEEECGSMVLCNTLEEKLLKPTPKLLEQFGQAYWTSRTKGDCKSDSSNNGMTCDKLNDKIMKEALEDGMNIVLEMRGLYYPGWVFDTYNDIITKKNYNVIMSWTVANLCSLINRNKTRSVTSMVEYLKSMC